MLRLMVDCCAVWWRLNHWDLQWSSSTYASQFMLNWVFCRVKIHSLLFNLSTFLFIFIRLMLLKILFNECLLWLKWSQLTKSHSSISHLFRLWGVKLAELFLFKWARTYRINTWQLTTHRSVILPYLGVNISFHCFNLLPLLFLNI